MIVPDCSALVAIVYAKNPQPDHLSAFAAARAICVPEYLMIEFLSATRRLASLGQIDEVVALAGIQHARRLVLHSYDTSRFAEEIWSLRHNFSAYDAGYIALARALNAPLLTCDQRLKSAAAAHTVVRVM